MTTTTLDETLLDELVRWYRDWYEDEIARLAQRYPNDQSVLEVEFSTLRRALPDVADDYLQDPTRIRDHMEEALSAYELPAAIDLSGATVRITGVTDAAPDLTYGVGDYLPSEVADDFCVVEGQVAKRTQPTLRPAEAVWECQRCGGIIRINQPRTESLQEPHECRDCERQGPFRPLEDEMAKTAVNHQLIRLQQPPEKGKNRSDATLDVVLEDDLVKSCAPGDRVAVGATIESTVDEDSDRPEIEFLAQADLIESKDSDFEDIDYEAHKDRIEEIANSDDPYQHIIDSILPSHDGNERIKEAIALQLFGGVEKDLPDGQHIRGTIHIFLVGDPGVGKSSLMRYVNRLAPRAVYTSGTGSTAAGLTSAAVQDDFGDGGWTLQAGALVEAHRGVCCVDELDDMQEEDRAGMLQAMSDQQIDISKAGINATLPAQTTVLAAANPEFGRFDPYEPIGDQVDIHPALLSRFDLIFPMTDKPDAEQDRDVARKQMQAARVGQQRANQQTEADAGEIEPAMEPAVLRAFIARAREIKPVLTEAAQQRIEDEYVQIRQSNDEDGPIPTTPRMNECLTRLATAAARIRLSDTVSIRDAERAIDIYREYLEAFGVDPESGDFDADMVETGTSKSQRDRVKATLKVIESLEVEYNSGAPIQSVVDHPTLDEWDETKINHTIDELKQKGEIYEHQTDYLRTT